SSRQPNAPRQPSGKPAPNSPTRACRCIVSRRCSKTWPRWPRTVSALARAPWRQRCSRRLHCCSSGPWTCCKSPSPCRQQRPAQFFSTLSKTATCGQSLKELRSSTSLCVPSSGLGARITAQFDRVPVGVAEFELLPIALGSPCRTDCLLDVDTLGLELSMQLVHVS